MPLTEQSIVPFGKYRGKSYGQMLKDVEYCKWLLNGAWLKGTTREYLEDCLNYSIPKKCKIQDD